MLQQASTIVSKPQVTTLNVTASIAQEIPYGYTGGWFGDVPYGDPLQKFIMNTTFAQVVNSYITRENIPNPFSGCSGECYGTVKAAGLASNCSRMEVPWDNNSTSPNFFNSSTVFSSNFTWIQAAFGENATSSNPTPEIPYIEYNLSYVQGRHIKNKWNGGGVNEDMNAQGGDLCNGTMVIQTCQLRSATLNYPIALVNGTLSLRGNSSSYDVDHIQPYGVKPDVVLGQTWEDFNPMSWSTLGGVVSAAQNMFISKADQKDFDLTLSGNLGSQYADYGPDGQDYITTQEACAMNWRDPTPDIMNALNEIMFRTALLAKDYSKYTLLNYTTDRAWTSYYEAWPITPPQGDNGVPVPQTLVMEQHANINIFQSHYSYLVGALGVMILGVLVVIPTFNGFWQLGRDISLNPLEIAKAFNPQILEGTGSNASSKHLDKTVGLKEVKYGEVVDWGFDSPENGREQEALRFRGRRLEFADPERIKEPEFNAVYD